MYDQCPGAESIRFSEIGPGSEGEEMSLLKICPKCSAVFMRGRWQMPDHSNVSTKEEASAEKEICPGCLKLERGIVEGVVHLEGSFFREHSVEVKNLIHRVAENKRHRNVGARIMSVRESEGKLTVETTEHTLAERIGKELEKAFSGDLSLSWQRKDQFVRVNWKRD